MAAHANREIGPPNYENVLDRMAELERRVRRVEDTDRKIRTAATTAGLVGGATVGLAAGVGIGLACPPAAVTAWVTGKAAIAVCGLAGGVGGGAVGAGAGAMVGQCLTAKSNQN